MPVHGSVPPVEQWLRDHPARRIETEHGELVQGLPIRLVIERESASAEIDLGEDARIYPSDEALKACATTSRGLARLVYGDETPA